MQTKIFVDLYYSSPSLKFQFTNQQEIRIIQLEYLQDLTESRQFIDNFVKEYPIPVTGIQHDDRKFALELLELYPKGMDFISNNSLLLKQDVSLLKHAMLKGWKNIGRVVNQQLWIEVFENDREFLMNLLLQDYYWYEKFSTKGKAQFTTQELLQLESVDEDFVRNLLTQQQINSLDRKDVLDVIVNRNIVADEFVANFKHDRDICLESIKRYRFIALQIDVKEFDWNNDQEAFDAILYSKNTNNHRDNIFRDHLSVLDCLPHLRDDREFVLKIIDHDPTSFMNCSERLKSDREIALRAISKDESMANSIHPSLSNDREVIMLACTKNGQVLRQASEELRSDRSLVLASLKSPFIRYRAKYIPESFHTDPEIRQAMIKTGFISSLNPATFSREEVLWCVSANGYSLSKFERYYSDEEIVLTSVKNLPRVLEHVPEKFRTFNVLMESITEGPEALKYIPSFCPFIDSLVSCAAKLHPTSFFNHLKSNYKFSKKEFMELVFNNDVSGAAFQFAPEELKDDREFVLKYIKRNGRIYTSLNENLKADPLIKKEAFKHGLNYGRYYE